MRLSIPSITLKRNCNPAPSSNHFKKNSTMNISFSIVPVVSLIAGTVILIYPRLLSTIVAVYLILVGLIGLLGGGNLLR